MHTRLCVALAFLGVLHAFCARADEAVSQRVHRCVGAHGEIVFSGLACAESAQAPAGTAAPVTAGGASAAAPASMSGDATVVCPATRAELRDRIALAINARNANVLAGLLRWQGVGGRAAEVRLRELGALVQRPLLALDDGAGAGTSDDDAPASQGDGLVVRVGAGDSVGVREHRFGIDQVGSCYWLTW